MENRMMSRTKERYIELMERALSAYSDGHILRYFGEVKEKGLTEHGFPRLTSNIGILISHGRRLDLKELFLEMMDFCCTEIPKVKAANDFSVREIINCIREVRASGLFAPELVEKWRDGISAIIPETCYNVFATSPEDDVKNWALFTGVSEFFRKQEGLGGTDGFIELQIASQMKWFDENGMYMDAMGDVHQPIIYDIAPRGLFATLLNEGYRGKFYDEIDAILKKSALYMLKMQSPNGEVAFGGRSNQFVHNEPWMIALYEYEAKRYFREGNLELARQFKAASARALRVTEYWLSLDPIYHVKNHFPTETKHGCEKYAYFDKYMITVASMLHVAYLIADDSVPAFECEDTVPTAFATSEHFHKLFIKAGGYGLEFDLNGDAHYDASGLGRLHLAGAPSAICLSVPCPEQPKYAVTVDNTKALSLCPAIRTEEGFRLATDIKYERDDYSFSTDESSASAIIRTRLDGKSVNTSYTVSKDGVEIVTTGEGDVFYALPALTFDGEKYTDITFDKNTLTVGYLGWICIYTVSGEIFAIERQSANRNGIYKTYIASGKKRLRIKIEIKKG